MKRLTFIKRLGGSLGERSSLSDSLKVRERRQPGFLNNARPGVSLLVAVLFISALLLVMAGLFEVQIRSQTAIRNRENDEKAKLLADSAVELASFWQEVQGVGFSTDDLTPEELTQMSEPLYEIADLMGVENCPDLDGNANNGLQSCVGFEVKGRPAAADRVTFDDQGTARQLYSVPMQGTGTAAEACGNTPADADDPCNWNKLAFDQVVEIPLYYETPDGVSHHPDLRDPESYWALRIRTPCEPAHAGELDNESEGCQPENRILLYPPVANSYDTAYLNVNQDKVLVQWLISSFDGEDVLLAREGTDQNHPDSRPVPDNDDQFNPNEGLRLNSQLSAGRLNEANDALSDPAWFLHDFIVLLKHLSGSTVSADTPTIADFLSPLDRSILRLKVVNRPRRADDPTPEEHEDRRYDLPALEYQLLTSEPMGDSKAVMNGFATVAGRLRQSTAWRARPTVLGGFVLENL